MNFYVLLNIGSVLLPLLFSFHPRINFYKEWKAVLRAISVTAIGYLAWDIWVTELGHWSFNPLYAGPGVIGGVPVGEILFFFCVPYSCLFVYKVITVLFPDRTIQVPSVAFWIMTAGFFLVSGFNLQRGYTFLSFLSCGVFMVFTLILKPDLLRSVRVWLYYLFSYVAFLLVNGVLTGMPVVLYNPQEFWGIRVITIPLEDFFYNFSFLGFNMLLYRRYSEGSSPASLP